MEFRNLAGFFGDTLPGRIVSNVRAAFSIGERAREADVFGAQPRLTDVQYYKAPGMLSRLLSSAGDRLGYTFICGAMFEMPPNEHGYIQSLPCSYEMRIVGDQATVDMACPACRQRGQTTKVNVQKLLDAMLPKNTKGETVRTEETLAWRDAHLPIRYTNQKGDKRGPRLVSTWDEGKSDGETAYEQSAIQSIGFGGPR